MIYADMPMTRFGKKKDYASEAEVDSEIASEFSSDERGDAEVLEDQVVGFIDNYKNDEYVGNF